jgi:hypothetical protein
MLAISRLAQTAEITATNSLLGTADVDDPFSSTPDRMSHDGATTPDDGNLKVGDTVR